MTLINFHTHRPTREPEEHVVQDGVDTWGIHPWHATASSTHTLPSPTTPILAIGECGLDSLCDTPMPVQLEAFRHCIRLSEEMNKPLYLHCVRQMGACTRLRQQMHCRQPWIWHNFRGNARRLEQLLSQGFWFSFGFRHRTNALHACPLDRMLLETDDDEQSIAMLYELVAQQRGIEVEHLARQMQANYRRLFGSEPHI